MDTVILAAGRGERLNGIMPSFWKPLLVVNGLPLIRQSVQLAHNVGSKRVVVVVAPTNAGPISEVLAGLNAMFVVQREPRGPGSALHIGLELTRDNKVMVLMGDNVLTLKDVSAVAEAEPFGIGVQHLPPDSSVERFTRRTRNGIWVEKMRLAEQDVCGDDSSTHGYVEAWVGPITIDANAARIALAPSHAPEEEIPIGPFLNDLCPGAQRVQVSSIDVGTPETVSSGETR